MPHFPNGSSSDDVSPQLLRGEVAELRKQVAALNARLEQSESRHAKSVEALTRTLKTAMQLVDDSRSNANRNFKAIQDFIDAQNIRNQSAAVPQVFHITMPERATTVNVDVPPAQVDVTLPVRSTVTDIERDKAGRIVRSVSREDASTRA